MHIEISVNKLYERVSFKRFHLVNVPQILAQSRTEHLITVGVGWGNGCDYSRMR